MCTLQACDGVSLLTITRFEGDEDLFGKIIELWVFDNLS